MAFKSRAGAQTGKSEADFISAADHVGAVAAPVPAPTPEPQASVALDPDAEPTKVFNLRVNDFELDQLRKASKKARRSMQQHAKAALFANLDV